MLSALAESDEPTPCAEYRRGGDTGPHADDLSTSFEDAVRNAVSLGGDADTLASIAGPIAEAMHGVPEDLVAIAQARFLSQAPDLVEVMKRMYSARAGAET